MIERPKLWILLVLGLGCSTILAQDRTDTEAKDQYGDISCLTNDNTGLMEASFVVFKNNSKVSIINFVNIVNDVYSGFYTANGCQWTGDGSLGDPWKVSLLLDPATDLPPTGNDGCGHSVVRTGEAYEWKVYTQREQRYHKDGDVLITFRCNKFGLPETLSTQYTDLGSSVIQIPSSVGSLSLDLTTEPILGTNPVLVTTIVIGHEYYIRIRLQPPSISSSAIDEDLVPWGAYCEKLFVTPDNDYVLRKVQLLDADGCPASGVGLGDSFVGRKPSTGDIYFSYAGPQEAWLFDKTASYPTNVPSTVHFVCEAILCWRPEDTMCIDRCTNRRKRRSSDNPLNDTYVIHTTITILPEDDTTQSDPDKSTELFIPIVAGVGGFALLLVLILFVCVVCVRGRSRKYRKHQDTSSMTSSADGTPIGKDRQALPHGDYMHKY